MSKDQFTDDYGFRGPLPVTSSQRLIPKQEGFPPGLSIGEVAPDFTLPNATGAEISFHADRAGARAAVLFFRSAVW